MTRAGVSADRLAASLFRRQARADFHHVGAVAPSGRSLATALAATVEGHSGRPRRILEIGPGTGAVTEAIAPRLGPADTLTVVERNAAFVDHLRGRIRDERVFQKARERIRIIQADVQMLHEERGFDAIVSSLPFNNFAADEVTGHLKHFIGMLMPGAGLAFFEYLWIRHIRRMCSGRRERQRLDGVGNAIATARATTRSTSRVVWSNLPPALVHRLQAPLPAASEGGVLGSLIAARDRKTGG